MSIFKVDIECAKCNRSLDTYIEEHERTVTVQVEPCEHCQREAIADRDDEDCDEENGYGIDSHGNHSFGKIKCMDCQRSAGAKCRRWGIVINEYEDTCEEAVRRFMEGKGL